MSDPLPAGSLDDQLTARLLHQRIIVLGQEVDDQIANRLCAELLLLSAEPAGVGQAASASGPVGRAARVRVIRAVRSTSRSPNAPETAPRISELGSLRPRSTSERYCVETPESSATSARVRSCRWRSSRSASPTASCQRGSVAVSSGRSRGGNAITSPMDRD